MLINMYKDIKSETIFLLSKVFKKTIVNHTREKEIYTIIHFYPRLCES